ncbi:CLUMA_CG014784, isoform A [Clunio marinus]|uniref:CLUMA_CG014784, isoform A n=1 Tax=Clunio marinus TaxID=568069 RepID=A0A1J1IN68_9DIPT|nr:CLUMA_CG014784, isoform A [Clunio marinus]
MKILHFTFCLRKSDSFIDVDLAIKTGKTLIQPCPKCSTQTLSTFVHAMEKILNGSKVIVNMKAGTDVVESLVEWQT